MQECTKRNVSTETKFRFHVFQDERFVDLNLYQYGWEQTEPLHSYGSYTKNPNPSPIEKRFGFSILTAVLPLDIPTGWEPRTNKSPTGLLLPHLRWGRAVQVLLSAVAVKEKLPYKTKKTAIKSCLSCGAVKQSKSEPFSSDATSVASPKVTVCVPSL